MPTSSLLLGLLAVASAPALALALAPGSLVNLPAGWKAGETVDAKYVVYNAKNSDAGRECVCASSFDAAHDYFPVKLGAESRAAGFTVTYHNSYKVINNTAAGVVHVGYQCGTPKPTEQALGFKPTAFVELPVSTIGVASTTDLPWIEFLGDRAAIKAVPGFGVTSACVKKMVGDGSAVAYSAKATKGLGHDINLCSQGWGCSGVANAVPIGANTETSVLGTASWIEYIAAFLNRERAAQDVISSIKAMFDCHESRAKADALWVNGKWTPKAAKKPKVLWAYYSDYPGYESWYPGTCPNYYCELIAAAGGEMIMFPTAPGNDHAKFFETAKTADVWLLASTNYDKMLNTDFTSSKFNMSNFTALLETMPAYQNGAIYDFQKNGQNDWFESRLAEPDVVLEDLIDIISPLASDGHKRVWWRNVKTEAVGGTEVVLCDDVNTPLLLKADACGKRGDAATATDSGKVSKRQAPRDTSRAAQPECVTWMETSNINAAGTTGNQPVELSAAGRAEMSLLAIAAAALVAVQL